MQWYTVMSGAFHYRPFSGTSVFENLVEAGDIARLRLSDYHVQEWNSNYYPDIIGHLRGPENSPKFASQRGGDSVFYCGVNIDGADIVFFEEVGKEDVSRIKCRMTKENRKERPWIPAPRSGRGQASRE